MNDRQFKCKCATEFKCQIYRVVDLLDITTLSNRIHCGHISFSLIILGRVFVITLIVEVEGFPYTYRF